MKVSTISPFDSGRAIPPGCSKAETEAQVLEFVRRGGKVQQIPHGASHDPNRRQIRLKGTPTRDDNPPPRAA